MDLDKHKASKQADKFPCWSHMVGIAKSRHKYTLEKVEFPIETFNRKFLMNLL